MRQWLVDPSILCQQHLLGEHVEHHMFVGSINKDIDVSGYVKDGLLAPETLRVRHDILVEEMLARGMNHKSPLPEINWDSYVYKNKVMAFTARVDIQANIVELAKRCEHCREHINNKKAA